MSHSVLDAICRENSGLSFSLPPLSLPLSLSVQILIIRILISGTDHGLYVEIGWIRLDVSENHFMEIYLSVYESWDLWRTDVSGPAKNPPERYVFFDCDKRNTTSFDEHWFAQWTRQIIQWNAAWLIYEVFVDHWCIVWWVDPSTTNLNYYLHTAQWADGSAYSLITNFVGNWNCQTVNIIIVISIKFWFTDYCNTSNYFIVHWFTFDDHRVTMLGGEASSSVNLANSLTGRWPI